MKVRYFILGTLAVLVMIGLVVFVWQKPQTRNGFANPKKTPHYESNTPVHGSTVAGVPINVVVDFNFDLAHGSAIAISHDGQDYGKGETTIDDNKLALRRQMTVDAPDGLYTVGYKACWPDGSCHTGHFQFKIDRSLASQFLDLRHQSEVMIDLTNFAFKPKEIKISPGTQVIWKNSDPVSHFINTDSHPAHTYFPQQNSRELGEGDTYSLTFTTPGLYPYHCSAHAAMMTGTLLVE